MNTDTPTNIWLEILKTDSVKYIIIAALIVCLYYLFKKEMKSKKEDINLKSNPLL